MSSTWQVESMKRDLVRGFMMDADNEEEFEQWRQQLDACEHRITIPAEVSDLKAFMQVLKRDLPQRKMDKIIVITRGGIDLMQIYTSKMQKNLQRYVEMFFRAGEKPRDGDLYKLKITTCLLYINDIFNKSEKLNEKIAKFNIPSLQHNSIEMYQMKIRNDAIYELETRVCESCDNVGIKRQLLKCGRCKMTYYCNAHCQKKDRKKHQTVCASLVENPESILRRKICLAWIAAITHHKNKLMQWCDSIEQKYKWKSRIFVIANNASIPSYHLFQLCPVSMRLFTSFGDNQRIKASCLLANKFLKENPWLIMIAIPYDGNFLFVLV